MKDLAKKVNKAIKVIRVSIVIDICSKYRWVISNADINYSLRSKPNRY